MWVAAGARGLHGGRGLTESSSGTWIIVGSPWNFGTRTPKPPNDMLERNDHRPAAQRGGVRRRPDTIRPSRSSQGHAKLGMKVVALWRPLRMREDTRSGHDCRRRQHRVRCWQLRYHVVEAVCNLRMVGVEMGSQLQIIGDDRLDAEASASRVSAPSSQSTSRSASLSAS